MEIALGFAAFFFLTTVVSAYLAVLFYQQGSQAMMEQEALEQAIEDSGLVWSDPVEEEDITIAPLVFDPEYEGEQPPNYQERDKIEAIGELKRNRWDMSIDT